MKSRKDISIVIVALLMTLGLAVATYAQEHAVTVKGKLLRGGPSGWQIALDSAMQIDHASVTTLPVTSADSKKLQKLVNKNVSATGTVIGSVLSIASVEEVKAGFWQKMQENAAYQKQQQEGGASAAPTASAKTSNKQEERAKYLETHACLTTDGGDKANELAGDCKKVTSESNKACNIQENTCDEIRSATQKGCWGLSASAPDFCLTKYR